MGVPVIVSCQDQEVFHQGIETKRKKRENMSRRKKGRKEETAPSEVIEAPRRGRTLIALDLANLYCQIKTAHADSRQTGPVGGDHTKLKSVLIPGDDECTMTCFAPISNPNDDHESYARTLNMHNMLRYCGYMVHTTERRSGRADVDVNLAVKSMAIVASGRYDCFILVSADGDFEPLLVYMRESGVKVVVASVSQYTSVRLKMNADELIDLYGWATTQLDESIKPVKSHDEILKRFDSVSSSLYELGKVMDDKSRRRLVYNTMSSAIGGLIGAYSEAGMDHHSLVLTTLKDCLDAVTVDCIDRGTLDFVMVTMEQLRTRNVPFGLEDDIRSDFSKRHSVAEA